MRASTDSVRNNNTLHHQTKIFDGACIYATAFNINICEYMIICETQKKQSRKWWKEHAYIPSCNFFVWLLSDI